MLDFNLLVYLTEQGFGSTSIGLLLRIDHGNDVLGIDLSLMMEFLLTVGCRLLVLDVGLD